MRNTSIRLRIAAASIVGLTAACGAATPSSSPPSASALPGGQVFDCAVQPGFEGQELHPIRVDDTSGLVTACRTVPSTQQEAMGRPLDDLLPDSMLADDSVFAAPAPGGAAELYVFWINLNCDQDAQVDVTPEANSIQLHVTQRRSGVCAPGTSPVLLSLQLSDRISADAVAATLERVEQ